MKRKTENRRVRLRDQNGNEHLAREIVVVVGTVSDGKLQEGRGTNDWYLLDGSPLNTDDDVEFQDLHGNKYSMI